MTYDNINEYLLLKQLLVTLQLTKVDAEVVVSGTVLSRNDIEKRVYDAIGDIRRNFTMPYGLLRGGVIHIDLSPLCTHLTGLCCDLPEDCWELKVVNEVMESDNFMKTIFEYPKTDEIVQEYKENLAGKNFYDCGRRICGELIEAAERALDEIRRWAEGSNDLPLEQVILLVNLVEMTDWVFAFTNDVYGVTNDDVAGQA